MAFQPLSGCNALFLRLALPCSSSNQLLKFVICHSVKGRNDMPRNRRELRCPSNQILARSLRTGTRSVPATGSKYQETPAIDDLGYATCWHTIRNLYDQGGSP